VEGEKGVIKAARSRFSLSTLPATKFPIEDINAQQTVDIQAPLGGVVGAGGRCAPACPGELLP